MSHNGDCRLVASVRGFMSYLRIAANILLRAENPAIVITWDCVLAQALQSIATTVMQACITTVIGISIQEKLSKILPFVLGGMISHQEFPG